MRPIDADALLNEAEYDSNFRLIIPAEKVKTAPTLTPPNEWVSVEDELPKKDGWYLVYAPGYWGNSKIYGLDGLAYSNFKHNYKVHWGIERGTGRGWPGIVTHWMPLPAPPDRRPPEGEEEP